MSPDERKFVDMFNDIAIKICLTEEIPYEEAKEKVFSMLFPKEES